MKNTRIIVRMDIKGPNLVKGIHMEGLRVLGKSEDFAEYYYKNGADELFYQDVVASLYERNSLFELVKKTANAISIPLTVGGGIRNLDDIKSLNLENISGCLSATALHQKKITKKELYAFS